MSTVFMAVVWKERNNIGGFSFVLLLNLSKQWIIVIDVYGACAQQTVQERVYDRQCVKRMVQAIKTESSWRGEVDVCMYVLCGNISSRLLKRNIYKVSCTFLQYCNYY